MKIAYCTRLIPHIQNLYEKFPNNKFIVSVDKFIMNQVVGMEEVTGDSISIINIPEVPSYPRFPAILMRKLIWSHNNIGKDIDVGFINLPFFRQIMIPGRISKQLRSWIKEYKDEKKIIITYSTNPMCMSPLVKAKRFDDNIKIVLVVGDLIGDKGINLNGKGIFSKALNSYYQRGNSYVSEFDGYILLTEYMAKELHVENKPYLIIEGIYNKSNENNCVSNDNNSDLKIVFHAGALERQYGVFNLINAFSMIKNDNYRLWLAGGSSESEEIKRLCENDSRINYFGFISPAQVYDLQSKATVIVNPRTTSGEFTKYSFPSKTMEGLASGKPFIGCRLPGIPDEYFDYIQCVDDNTPESLSRKITEICELSISERTQIGNRSRDFIISKKNCNVQGHKMVEFLESL